MHWNLLGQHNRLNALAAIASARDVGVSPALACEALSALAISQSSAFCMSSEVMLASSRGIYLLSDESSDGLLCSRCTYCVAFLFFRGLSIVDWRNVGLGNQSIPLRYV